MVVDRRRVAAGFSSDNGELQDRCDRDGRGDAAIEHSEV